MFLSSSLKQTSIYTENDICQDVDYFIQAFTLFNPFDKHIERIFINMTEKENNGDKG